MSHPYSKQSRDARAVCGTEAISPIAATGQPADDVTHDSCKQRKLSRHVRTLHRAYLNSDPSDTINSRTEAGALCVISDLAMVLPGGVTPHSTCHLLRNRWHQFCRAVFDCRKSCNLRFVASDIGRHSQFVMYLASMTEDGITSSFVEFSCTYSKSRLSIKYVSAFTR